MSIGAFEASQVETRNNIAAGIRLILENTKTYFYLLRVLLFRLSVVLLSFSYS